MKYVFDVKVQYEGYKEEHSVVAVDDLDARKKALDLEKKANGKDYEDLVLLYCEISMVRRIS